MQEERDEYRSRIRAAEYAKEEAEGSAERAEDAFQSLAKVETEERRKLEREIQELRGRRATEDAQQGSTAHAITSPNTIKRAAKTGGRQRAAARERRRQQEWTEAVARAAWEQSQEPGEVDKFMEASRRSGIVAEYDEQD